MSECNFTKRAEGELEEEGSSDPSTISAVCFSLVFIYTPRLTFGGCPRHPTSRLSLVIGLMGLVLPFRCMRPP